MARPLACHADARTHRLLLLSQDRLPTPFGLVRSGVAPDHQDVKVWEAGCGSEEAGCAIQGCQLTAAAEEFNCHAVCNTRPMLTAPVCVCAVFLQNVNSQHPECTG